MFSDRDRIKEVTTYLMEIPNVQMTISTSEKYEQKGVAVVKTFVYNIGDTQVVYDKWIVESFAKANQMQLPGCEYHNKLVGGSGVNVLSKKMGSYVFYGKDAQDIINSCEMYRMEKIQRMTNNLQNIR